MACCPALWAAVTASVCKRDRHSGFILARFITRMSQDWNTQELSCVLLCSGNHPDGSGDGPERFVATGNALIAVLRYPPFPEFAPTARFVFRSRRFACRSGGGIGHRGRAGHQTIRGNCGARFNRKRATFCVHPCDEKLDRAYEASWMQTETKASRSRRLLPDALPSVLFCVWAEIV